MNRRSVMLAVALAIAGLAAGCGSSAAKPGPAVTVTATQTVPGPETTVTVSPPPPAAGAKIGHWSGSGNQVTPAFDVPDGGSYIVTWSYYGNSDTSFGDSSPSNFSIQNTSDGYGQLPNDIAASGSGSTEITGVSGATDRFNVGSVGHWSITVKAA